MSGHDECASSVEADDAVYEARAERDAAEVEVTRLREALEQIGTIPADTVLQAIARAALAEGSDDDE